MMYLSSFCTCISDEKETSFISKGINNQGQIQIQGQVQIQNIFMGIKII